MPSETPTQISVSARLVGGDIDMPLRPVLGVAFLQAIAESAQWSFFGLWALRALGSSQGELGLAFAAAAVAAVIAGYVGGRLSDRVGRRKPILTASAALPGLALCLGFVGGHALAGLVLMVCLIGVGGVLLSTQQALITDLVPPERHEHAFAAARVVQNMGLVAGPLIGAALVAISWPALFFGTAAIAGLAFVVAVQAIPRGARSSLSEPGRRATLGTLARDPSFAILLVAGTLAAMVYVSYLTLLPISLVQSHGLAPTTWGFLVAINPIVVAAFQIRLTNKLKHISEFTRIAVGVVAMGTPFLFVAVSTALPLLVLMLLLFVLGEMLWAPPAQALIVRRAPDDMRGAYLGASSATLPAAVALAPIIGLQVRSTFGDSAMWFSVAIMAVLAIALYAVFERVAGRHAKSI